MMTERKLIYEFPIAIRWGDMDAMGHVNNTVYFRYMEQARISWFDAMGFSPDPSGQGPVIVSTACNFRRELCYPGTVLVRQWVGDLGNSSFNTWMQLSRQDDRDTVYAEGEARVVWVDFPKRRSTPLPAQVREAILLPRTGLV